MVQSKDKIRSDFDRIALLADKNWDHNSHYHPFLLRHMPKRCQESLEIGCGKGAFARLLAQRSDRVIAIDLSPRMIEIAKQRSAQCPNIDFRIADAETWDFPVERLDYIVSIAALHHLPLEPMLIKMKDALKVNGALVVLDLFLERGVADRIRSAIAAPTSFIFRLIKNRRFRESNRAQEAWTDHGQSDSYLTLAEVRKICKTVLPGSRVKKHLFWRYSITWTKPAK